MLIKSNREQFLDTKTGLKIDFPTLVEVEMILWWFVRWTQAEPDAQIHFGPIKTAFK